jgi:hypothetical protein
MFINGFITRQYKDLKSEIPFDQIGFNMSNLQLETADRMQTNLKFSITESADEIFNDNQIVFFPLGNNFKKKNENIQVNEHNGVSKRHDLNDNFS